MSPTSLILLAEDDSNDALLIQRALRKADWKFPLVRVTNGEEAIDYLCGRGIYSDRIQHPFPSLLLLDLRMPRKSGFDVLEWLQAQMHLQMLEVVVIASCLVNADTKRAYALGAKIILIKSANFDSLVEHLAKLRSDRALVREHGIYY